MTATITLSYKVRIRMILTVLILLLFISLIHTFKMERGTCNSSGSVNIIDSTFCQVEKPEPAIAPRQSITFILGEDEDLRNPYYNQATNYYLNNPEDKTEIVITNCRSLLEVRDYLEKNHAVKGQPWGLINLVSHGNQWLGLSVRVIPGSRRATPDRILEYVQNGMLKPLADSIVDSGTEIFIHGCGIGNNPEILKAIAQAFGGTDVIPIVKASKLFEYYSSKEENGVVCESHRYFAQTWNICYKMGEQPGHDTLQKLFEEKYPSAPIRFSDALKREEPRWTGDAYSYTFEVPAKFTIKKSDIDTLPEATSGNSLISWVSRQPEISNMLEKIEIPAKNFTWSVTQVYIKDENGKKVPALWVKGYCTVHCVIKPLVDESRQFAQK